ncbi:MAG TPA: hypothetical protein VHE99_10050 [Gammaproteobacteria bacterium]|nr:hypothetical protein [Gammaproteobacteria bacterium]
MYEQQKSTEIKVEFPQARHEAGTQTLRREKKINIETIEDVPLAPLESTPEIASPSSSPIMTDIIPPRKIVISVGQALLLSIEKTCELIKENLESLRDTLDWQVNRYISELRSQPLFSGRPQNEQKKKQILITSETVVHRLGELSDNYDKLKANLEELARLKKLYLCGVDSEISADAIEKEIKKYQNTEYEVSKDFKITTSEASRRYFETHLALATLKYNLNNINIFSLIHTYEDIYNKLDYRSQLWLSRVEIGEPDWQETTDDSEYLDLFKKIPLNEYAREKKFSLAEKDLLKYIVKIAYAAPLLTIQDKSIPLGEVFTEGYFAHSGRGREFKDQHHHVSSNNLGILQSSMPVPLDDLVRASETYPFFKSTDRDRPQPSSLWVEHCSATLIHPFSCSISGHYLGLLRVFLALEQNKKLRLKTLEQFKNFSKCYASIILAHSGGHSFYEFFAVLALEKIRQGFSFISGFDTLNMASLLLEGNEKAFDEALHKTLVYNKALLNKAKLHHSLDHFHVYTLLYSSLEKAVTAASLTSQEAYKIYTNPTIVELIRKKILTVDEIVNNPQISETYTIPAVKEAIVRQEITGEDLKKLAKLKAEGVNMDSIFTEIITLRQNRFKRSSQLLGLGIFQEDGFNAAMEFLKSEGDSIYFAAYDIGLNKKDNMKIKRCANGYQIICGDISQAFCAGLDATARENVVQRICAYLRLKKTDLTSIHIAKNELAETKKTQDISAKEFKTFTDRYGTLMAYCGLTSLDQVYLKFFQFAQDCGLEDNFFYEMFFQSLLIEAMLHNQRSIVDDFYSSKQNLCNITSSSLLIVFLNGWINGKTGLLMQDGALDITKKVEAFVRHSMVLDADPKLVLHTLLKQKPNGSDWPAVTISLVLLMARAWWKYDELDNDINDEVGWYQTKDIKTKIQLDQPQKDAEDLINYIDSMYFNQDLDTCVILWEALRENEKRKTKDMKEKAPSLQKNPVIAEIEEKIFYHAIDRKKPEIIEQLMKIKTRDGDTLFTCDHEIYRYAVKRKRDDICKLLLPEPSQQADMEEEDLQVVGQLQEPQDKKNESDDIIRVRSTTLERLGDQETITIHQPKTDMAAALGVGICLFQLQGNDLPPLQGTTTQTGINAPQIDIENFDFTDLDEGDDSDPEFEYMLGEQVKP